jgi:serine/threonine-protein kinase
LLATIPALLAALWPPLGSATTAAGFVATAGLLATRPVSFAITAAIALVLLGWWLRCGTQSWLSTPSFVAPLCLHAPIAGVPVAAYAYAGSPLIAGLSATLSWLFARVWLILVPVAFRPDATIAELFAPFLYPSSLVALVGVGLSAALAARITGVRATTGRTIVGQLLCCVVLVFSQLTSQRMENGGIWPQPSWATTGVAVLLCVLVCTASVLYGPREEHGE